MMFKKISNWKKRKVCVRLRKELLFWGIDTQGIADREIEQGCLRVSKFIALMGFTCNDTIKGLIKLGKIGNKVN